MGSIRISATRVVIVAIAIYVATSRLDRYQDRGEHRERATKLLSGKRRLKSVEQRFVVANVVARITQKG